MKINSEWKKIFDKEKDEAIVIEKFPYKITTSHIERANEFMKKNLSNKITIQSLKEHLETIEGLHPLSKSGTRYLLVKILKYSYKKAHRLPK